MKNCPAEFVISLRPFRAARGRGLESDLDDVAFDQLRRRRAARFRGRSQFFGLETVSVLMILRVLPSTDAAEMT